MQSPLESETFDLDERMTEETKRFVVNSLRVIKPSQVPKIDINISRQARKANTQRLNAGLKFALKSKEFFIKNSIDEHEIPVTLYVPDDVKEDSPITIFYHGGGWTFGSRESHFYCVGTLATTSKTIWLSVDYRLAPESKFQTQISDCKSVVEWVVKNKSELGYPNATIGVCGDSAGGHLSAIIAHEHKASIDYQILVYPCVDLATHYDSIREFSKECYILTPEMIEFFARNLLTDHSEVHLPNVSPLFIEDYSNLPKCLIIAAELDPLIDNCRAYHKKLNENSIECDFKLVKGTIHGFFHNGILLKDAFNESLKHVAEFLEKL